MEILITNTDQDPIEIDYDDWSLDRYADAHRASELKIVCARRTPISKFARVEAREDGEIVFRGYVRAPSIKSLQRKELQCKGDEDLLLRRFSGRYSFSSSMYHLTHLFEDTPPSQTPDEYDIAGNVGLIYLANSKIPHYGNVINSWVTSTSYSQYSYVFGSDLSMYRALSTHASAAATEPGVGADWMTVWVLVDPEIKCWHSYNGPERIYRLPRLGLNSRVGSADIYIGGQALPRATSYAELLTIDSSSFSDENDLYIRNDLSGALMPFNWGPRNLLSALNAYDTNVRRGTIDKPEFELDGNLQLSFNRMLDALISIPEYYELQPRFRYSADGYTYLDILEDPSEDQYELIEADLQDIRQSIANDPAPTCLIGLGFGSRDVQHLYSCYDPSYRGTWYEETYEIDSGFIDSLGILQPGLDREYARRANEEVFTVLPIGRWGHRPKPNDIILLKLDNDAYRELQVQSIKRNAKGRLEMELGVRKDDIIDAFQAKSSLQQVYQAEYLVQMGVDLTGSCNVTIPDYVDGWGTYGSFTFTVPSGVLTTDYSHRVTMDLAVSVNAKPGTCWLNIELNSITPNFLMQPDHYLLNDTITGLDITRYVNYGSSSTCKIWGLLRAEWDGSSPTATANATIRAWNRILPDWVKS